MINIIPTKNITLIKSIFPMEPNLLNDFRVIAYKGDLIGLFEIQPITSITGILHMHIIKEFQNQGLAIKAFNQLIEDLKSSPFKQLIGSIPEHNKNIMSIVKKTQAKCCGMLEDAIIFNGKLQNLVLFQLEIK